MKLSQILPNFKKNERSIFFGQSGSGKSTLAQKIISLYPYSVVLDTKHDLTGYEKNGFKIFDNLSELIKNPSEKNLFRPSIESDFDDDFEGESQTAFFKWIWLRKHTALYIDEATSVSNGTRINRYLHHLITKGRSRGCPVLAGSQRPSGLKVEFFSEAQNVYCFHLSYMPDKEKVFKSCGIDTDLISAINKEKGSDHYFIYSKNGKLTKPLILQK